MALTWVAGLYWSPVRGHSVLNTPVKTDLTNPVIAPALFQEYPSAQDEWDLSTQMRADGTLQAKMEEHYDTFIVSLRVSSAFTCRLQFCSPTILPLSVRPDVYDIRQSLLPDY
jgi:hypothetical protein